MGKRGGAPGEGRAPAGPASREFQADGERSYKAAGGRVERERRVQLEWIRESRKYKGVKAGTTENSFRDFCGKGEQRNKR